MGTNEDMGLHTLVATLRTSIEEHSRWRRLDSFLWNGGTAAVLLATTAATIFAEELGSWASLLTAFAGFWVALERVLSFGARWRFHLQMQNGYTAIAEMIDYYSYIPPDKQATYRQHILDELFVLRRREAEIPGGGVVPNLEAPPAHKVAS